jgi:hypothetical protein
MSKTLMALALVLVAGLAIAADEKRPEGDYTIQNPSRTEITGELTQESPTWHRSFGSGTPSPACAFSLTLSGNFGQYFDAICIQVTDQGPIEVEVTVEGTTINDTTLHLFCDPFDSGDSLANAVFYNDDGGVGLLSAFTLANNIVLSPGENYWLVLSTFSAGDMGTYRMVTSDNVIVCGSVSLDQADWSTIKDLFR